MILRYTTHAEVKNSALQLQEEEEGKSRRSWRGEDMGLIGCLGTTTIQARFFQHSWLLSAAMAFCRHDHDPQLHLSFTTILNQVFTGAQRRVNDLQASKTESWTNNNRIKPDFDF